MPILFIETDAEFNFINDALVNLIDMESDMTLDEMHLDIDDFRKLGTFSDEDIRTQLVSNRREATDRLKRLTAATRLRERLSIRNMPEFEINGMAELEVMRLAVNGKLDFENDTMFEMFPGTTDEIYALADLGRESLAAEINKMHREAGERIDSIEAGQNVYRKLLAI